ncbi:hypothetical protein L9F63_011148, partial [Diploptera punctata]
ILSASLACCMILLPHVILWSYFSGNSLCNILLRRDLFLHLLLVCWPLFPGDLLSSLVTVVCMFFFSLRGLVDQRCITFTDPWLEEDGYPSSWSSRGDGCNLAVLRPSIRCRYFILCQDVVVF